MAFLNFLCLIVACFATFIAVGFVALKLRAAGNRLYTRLAKKDPGKSKPMVLLGILWILTPVAALIAVLWVFPHNVAQFAHLTKKLFGYPASRLTLEFPPLTPEEQQHVVKQLNFLLEGSAETIRYRLVNVRTHTSHVERDTVPAYFQWQDGHRLILVTGQAYPPDKAQWLRQLLTLGTGGEQELPQEAEVAISGEEKGRLHLALQQASLDIAAVGSRSDRLLGKADFACVLAIPLRKMSPLILHLAARAVTAGDTDMNESVTATFPDEIKLARKSYPVIGVDSRGTPRTPRLLLGLSRHAAKDFRWDSDRVAQCGPKTMALLEPAWQTLLAKQALRELALPNITHFSFEGKVTFSPWYAEGTFQPVYPPNAP